MTKNREYISEAMIGPFYKKGEEKNAQNAFYATFRAQNDQGVTFILNKGTEKTLQDTIDSTPHDQIERAIADAIPQMKQDLKDLYKTLFDFSFEGVDFAPSVPKETPRTRIIGPFELSAEHSHAEDMGVNFEAHGHSIKAYLRLDTDGHNIKVSSANAKVLHEKLQSVLDASFSEKSMEYIGENAFEQGAKDVENITGYKLKAIEMYTPYDGSLDHPTTAMTFNTQVIKDNVVKQDLVEDCQRYLKVQDLNITRTSHEFFDASVHMMHKDVLAIARQAHKLGLTHTQEQFDAGIDVIPQCNNIDAFEPFVRNIMKNAQGHSPV